MSVPVIFPPSAAPMRVARGAPVPARIVRQPDGFTLIEMLAVIVLIGIVAVATAMSVTRGLDSARASAASSELAADLRATRAQAVVRNTQTSFELDILSKDYHGADGRVGQVPRDVRVAITSAREDQPDEHTGRIRFFPDGSSTGGRITLRQGAREWHVDVNALTGAVDVVESSGSSP